MAVNDAKQSALPTITSPDRTTSTVPVLSGGVNYQATINNMLGLSSAPVGLTDSQTLTNKTLTAPTLASPIFSGTITGTYTLGGTPTFPATVVSTTGTQTLTNKTLTSPVLTTPTLTNASISADAITGFTTSNSGTIYGVPIASAKIAGSSITNSTIGPNQLATGAQVSKVVTSETTTSTAYVALATAQAITVTVGVNGLLLVAINAQTFNSGSNTSAMTIALSGANTLAANDDVGLYNTGTSAFRFGAMTLLTGLTPGSTVVTALFKTAPAGTATFANRTLIAIPL